MYSKTVATGYAHFASAIINGDDSGLNAMDHIELERFLAYCGEYKPVSTAGEEYFGRPSCGGLKGNVIGYLCVKEGKK